MHVLHVNHHLRGEESEADETLVRRLCERLGVGLTVAHRPVEKAGGNVQETARDARRAAALDLAGQLECARIVLGHTADDQVETMLYRLGRYGGLAAFRGMAVCDPPWVRPLLTCRREETAGYCLKHDLEYAEDRGNIYPGYARTGIRERVVPAWEAELPGGVEAACRAAEVAAEMERLVSSVLAEAAGGVVGPDVDIAEAEGLSAAGLLGLRPEVRRLLLHRWLEGRARPAASRAAVLAVEALAGVPGSAQRALAGGWRVHKEYDRLLLQRCVLARPPVPAPVPLEVPGRAAWGELLVTAEVAEVFRGPDVSREAYVDARCIDGPLQVRGPAPGDRIRPLGAGGTRKLQDVLVDLRVPARARPGTPLVVCGERILWVGGLVMAEEGRITGDTTALVRLSLDRRLAGEADASESADIHRGTAG